MPMSPRTIRLLVAALLTAAPAPVVAAPAAPPQATTLSPADTRALIDEIARRIGDSYVVPARRKPIVDALRAAQKQGRYDVANPTDLAERLTQDLTRAGDDQHLWVQWDPAAFKAAQTPPDEAEGLAFFTEMGRRHNQGVEALRILGGNVRYLKYSMFMWQPDVSGQALDDAVRFLKGGDAVVLDLRGNGGGHPSAVQYLISHFIDDPGRLLVTFRDELEKSSRESRVLEHLPAGRITKKPLYVLTDGGTGSAAEEFAYHVKQFKLGTLVGRKTAGAAHNNAVIPVSPGFLVSISTGRPIHAVGGGDWEGAGVAPDVAASAAEALDVAHLHALDALAGKAQDPQLKAAYTWARADVSARLRPPAVAANELARHAGRYGDRTVRVERGALVYARPGRDDVRLTPLGGDLFAISGERRIRFVTAGGKTTALEVLFADGQTQRFDRAAR